MSSPFGYFRKRQKALLAIATVFIVFIFVIGSAIKPGGGGDAERGAQKVADWNGGQITAAELGTLTRNRRITSNFVQVLVMEGIRAGGQEDDLRLPEGLDRLLLAGLETDENRLEADVLSTIALSDAADAAGIRVDDRVINELLDTLGSHRVKSADIVSILRHVTGDDSRTAQAVVFSTLRRILQAYFYQGSFTDSAVTVLPAQQWEAWKRTNERISLQAAVLPVASFVAEVSDPTDAQVKEFYNEFKDREPNQQVIVGGRRMPSPDPGFARPRRVVLTFLRGSVADLTEELMPKVTDKEITDFYESNKRTLFVKETEDESMFEDEGDEDAADSMGDSSDDATESDESMESVEAAEMGDQQSGDEPTAEESDDADAAEPSESDAEPAMEEVEDDVEEVSEAEADDAAAESNEASEAGQETVDAAEDATEEAGETPAAGDGAAVDRPASPFRLAAFQTESADSTAAAVEDAADPAETAAADSDTAEEAAEEAVEDAAEEAMVSEETAVDEEAAADEEGEEEEEVVEYEPLEAVAEEIRREVARQKAVEQIRSDVRNVYEQLRTRYSAYRRDVATAIENKTEPPAPPKALTDLEPLAEKYGYKVETTGKLTQRQLYEDTLVGQAFEPDRQQEIVAQAEFSHLQIGEPYFAVEQMGDCYVLVKTEDEPREVPALDKVRSKVVAAWRRREAAKLAEKKAQDLAVAVRTADRSFTDYMADLGYQVIPQTDMFSWMTFGLAPNGAAQLRISEAPGLENIGSDFMEKVFSLKEGETAALMNVDRSAAFVVKLHSRERTEQELQEAYLTTGWITRDPRVAGTLQLLQQAGLQEMQRGLMENIGFEFDEDWQQMRREQMEEEQN
ncbi:MAG: hypothetical protein KDA44_22190 [Planctomycetales bacterium]|nr:hypothetical protein [Planctomycetales bacterium]